MLPVVVVVWVCAGAGAVSLWQMGNAAALPACLESLLAALVLVDAFLIDIPFIYNDPPNFWGLGGFLLVAVSSGFQLWRSRRGSA